MKRRYSKARVALVELPANWDELTLEEQDRYLKERWNDLRYKIANGRYELAESES